MSAATVPAASSANAAMRNALSVRIALWPDSAVDRVARAVAGEGQGEQPGKPDAVPRIPIFGDPDGHRRMTLARLVAVRAEQPVPPRQVEAEVAVRLVGGDRMMHA